MIYSITIIKYNIKGPAAGQVLFRVRASRHDSFQGSDRCRQAAAQQRQGNGEEQLTAEHVYRLLGTAHVDQVVALAKTILERNPKEALELLGRSLDEGLQLGELAELLGYSLKRAQLKVFEDFLRCVAPLQLTPAQFSVLLLLDRNPGRNQTEIANTLGILRPNFVSMLDALESRGLCARMRSTNDRRSHILVLTDKGRAVLARAKKLVASKHEARLNELLGPANRVALLEMLSKIAAEF